MRKVLSIAPALAAIWLAGNASGAADSPFGSAVAVWHMADANDSAGKNSLLAPAGEVELGVKLEGAERDDSLLRGGDGVAAVFRGGYLSAGQGADSELNLGGKCLTIAIRLRDPVGLWSYPIFSKYGGHGELVYNVFATLLDGRKVVGGEIGSTKNDRILQTICPVASFDPGAWHDIALRLNGAKMELFVDGGCVDEDFMLGALRPQNRMPVLIGAQAVDETRIDGGFRGVIDHVCLWDRPLADEEIIALAGGPNRFSARQRTDRGLDRETMQYWRPPNNYFVGDCMPFSHDGTFHFAYLLDRKHHASKNGLGAHQWAQATTQDLVHWRHEPLMLAIDEQWEGSICTGSTFFHEGIYYAVYATRASGLRFPAGDQYFNVATSRDGIHFRKSQPNPLNAPPSGYAPEHWRDPFGRHDPEAGIFHVLVTAHDLGKGGCLAHLVSKDMKEFEYAEPMLYTRDFPGTGGEPECSDWFSWGAWHYLIYNGCYLVSQQRFGPWRLPENYRLDGSVMKTAPFGRDRRIGAAWISHVGWGFRAIFREAVQLPDGALGWKFVPEMNPAAGDTLAEARGRRLVGRGRERLAGLPANYRLTATVAFGNEGGACGLRFRDADAAPGLELRIDPDPGSLKLGSSEKSVKNLAGRVHRIEVFVANEITDVCFDDMQTVVVCEQPRPGDGVTLWSENPVAEIRDLDVRPLLH
jgi:beta-fructofuranosidase